MDATNLRESRAKAHNCLMMRGHVRVCFLSHNERIKPGWCFERRWEENIVNKRVVRTDRWMRSYALPIETAAIVITSDDMTRATVHLERAQLAHTKPKTYDPGLGKPRTV